MAIEVTNPAPSVIHPQLILYFWWHIVDGFTAKFDELFLQSNIFVVEQGCYSHGSYFETSRREVVQDTTQGEC